MLPPFIITQNHGGSVAAFERLGEALAAQRRTIMVDGVCESACTVLLDEQHASVCITSNALLRYHLGYWAQGRWRQHYSAPVRAWLDANGGEPAQGWLDMSFTSAKAFYRVCKPSDWS